jgi:3-oxoacyl-(acyl-carrier-protein) synthase
VTAIRVAGVGAVSPAGWGARALAEAVRDGRNNPVEDLERELAGDLVRSRVRRVPVAGEGGGPPRHPRLRRGSAIARFAAAAAAEALGEERLAAVEAGTWRLGVIFTLMNGCVNYSNRFFGEVLADPSLASPILFPETVRNAPASHLSAVFGTTAPNDTLIGDGAVYLPALELAAEWIERREVDGCVVVGAEELDWLSAEGLSLYSRRYVAAEGAGAVLLEASDEPGVRLMAVPDAVSLKEGREKAARAVRAELRVRDDGETVLVEGRAGVPRWDEPEEAAWADWRGPRCSPRMVVGEGMGASAAWQTVVAIEELREGRAKRAVISAVGGNQQAAGAVFEAVHAEGQFC